MRVTICVAYVCALLCVRKCVGYFRALVMYAMFRSVTFVCARDACACARSCGRARAGPEAGQDSDAAGDAKDPRRGRDGDDGAARTRERPPARTHARPPPAQSLTFARAHTPVPSPLPSPSLSLSAGLP